jgi:[acyl-carrier-protein] S-malonyltransferase
LAAASPGALLWFATNTTKIFILFVPHMTLAFVFPGQGSQAVGMLRELAGSYQVVEATFADASSVLGYDLWRLVQEGPETDLNMTERTQPAMLAAGVAVWRVWMQQGGAKPIVLAGHSLGEYTALVCGGALAFQNAVTLVATRGRCMQEAVLRDAGAMAAVLGLEIGQLEQICAEASAGEMVTCANFNAPGQIVIAGNRAAVERAIAAAKAAGAKRALLLPVSVPSHCPLMRDAAARLQPYLQGAAWSKPSIPVIHNVDLEERDDADGIVAALSRQLYQPVRWIETVQKLHTRGVTRIIECGPGKVLTGLCKRIESRIECLPVFDTATLAAALGDERV